VELDRAHEGRRRFRGILIGVKDHAAGMRLSDTPEAGDVWLPLEDIGEAKLVLTDALINAAPRSDAPSEVTGTLN
jgi:ribosome maturation factor RimP